TAHDVIAHTREVFYTTATNKNHGVFLQVVTFTADIRNNFETVGQAHFGNFTHRRVRFFRCGGIHASAYATTLRAVFKCRTFAALMAAYARFTHELADGWHDLLSYFMYRKPVPIYICVCFT